MILMLLLQIEWIGKLIEKADAQSFSALIMAVMIGMLCIAIGAIWRQYIVAINKVIKNQEQTEQLIKLLNNQQYDATKELIVRMEAERRFKS